MDNLAKVEQPKRRNSPPSVQDDNLCTDDGKSENLIHTEEHHDGKNQVSRMGQKPRRIRI